MLIVNKISTSCRKTQYAEKQSVHKCDQSHKDKGQFFCNNQNSKLET